jgi:hypothetical protein
MKKIFTVLSAVLLSASLWAQAPQSFSYQAVVRGADNALVANKKVGMKISLLQGSEIGKAVYVETHTPTSNANGLVSIAIGGGTVVSGTFASIDWSKGPYFVKTETDLAGGTSYSLITTSQLMSVPFALYSANSQPGPKGDKGDIGATGPQGTFPSGTKTGEMKYWDGSSWVSLTPGTQNQSLSFCDGLPTWTTGGICPGKIASLNCAGVSVNGSLNNGELASNVSFVITYTGGNAGSYSSQSISSTSVVGLTATLQAGSFATGNGSLTFTVSGTPSSVGNALFSFTIAGQVCSISMAVVQAPVETDFQFTATINGSTYSFKDKTFNEQGLLDGLNDGALCKTYQDTTAMVLRGVNAAKDDTLMIYFMDKSGASKSSFAIGNTTFPLVDLNAGEPTKMVYLKTSKSSDEFTCFLSGDNCTLTVTKSDVYSPTSAIKGTFEGKVSSTKDAKQYSFSGSFRAKKVKD